jgi:hypothetical protein
VGVAVDQSGRDPCAAGGADLAGVDGGELGAGADPLQATVGDQQRAVVDRAVRVVPGHHRGEVGVDDEQVGAHPADP